MMSYPARAGWIMGYPAQAGWSVSRPVRRLYAFKIVPGAGNALYRLDFVGGLTSIRLFHCSRFSDH